MFVNRRCLATFVALAVSSSGLSLAPAVRAAAVGAAAVRAAAVDSTPWVLPSMPTVCSSQQAEAGTVADCLLDGKGLPDLRGWPRPPFPKATTTPTTWVDLSVGSSGALVAKVQQALTTAGFPAPADGMFAQLTAVAVANYQTAEAIPPTGVVDEATAGALGLLDQATGTFPPVGWTWPGWTYNGSPALRDWEKLLIGNQGAVGPVKANQLRSMPESLPLFEGFVRDIVAGGYKITDVSTYNFRCTSTSLRNCQGLTSSQLSNHSWGLALDMNSGANPEMTYYGVNAASACATPMKTDIPMWVVRAAERWGLYWGGYGWSGGCPSPSQTKTSVRRDAMHFEFRGTPTQARAIATPNTASGCLEVASDAGAISPRCLAPSEVPAAGWRVVVNTKAPTGSTAALVNITVTDAAAAGYVTAEVCTALPAGPRISSNGNTAPGRTVANLAVVALDSSGRFCLYRSAPMHSIVDVQGFFAPAASSAGGGTMFTSVAPQRVMDTRAQSFCAPTGSCTEKGPVPAGTEIVVAAAAVAPNAVAMLANLTVTEPTSAGYLTADACSTLVAGPQTRSNANFAAGDTVANLAVVPVANSAAGAQFCTYSTAQAQKIVDVQGFFAPPSANGWGYTSTTPQRLVDTRDCWTDLGATAQRCGQINAAGSIIHVQAPPGASAVLINLTLTGATAAGYATADACSVLVSGPQTKSNGNVARGVTTANLAVVTVDADGSFCITVSAPMHVVVDVQGMFSPTGQLRFTPITPVRRHDSRQRSG